MGPLKSCVSSPDADSFVNFSVCRAGIVGPLGVINTLTFCGFGTGRSSEGWCGTKTLAKNLIGKCINKHHESLCSRQDVRKEDTCSRCRPMVHFFSSRRDERQGELKRAWLIVSYVNGIMLIFILHTPLYNLWLSKKIKASNYWGLWRYSSPVWRFLANSYYSVKIFWFRFFFSNGLKREWMKITTMPQPFSLKLKASGNAANAG